MQVSVIDICNIEVTSKMVTGGNGAGKFHIEYENGKLSANVCHPSHK